MNPVMRNAPRVSVIVPAYYASKYLGETLDSLATQRFADWEVVIVEDGSDDGTRAIVTEFARQVTQPVHYLSHPENRGLSAARNSAIQLAKGQWLALLDADDLWMPEHLELCLRTGEAQNAGLVVSGSVLFDSDTGEDLGYREPGPGDLDGLPATLFRETFFQPSASVLNRDAFGPLGFFDSDVRVCEDIELWLRACRAGIRFVATGRRTCRYRKHGSGITSHGGRIAEAKARVYARFLDYEAVPRKLRYSLTGKNFASAGKIFFRSESARSCVNYASAWRVQPLRIDWLVLSLAAQFRSQFLRSF